LSMLLLLRVKSERLLVPILIPLFGFKRV
jgi:hypothetical protein